MYKHKLELEYFQIMLTYKNVANLTVVVDFSNVDFIDYSSAHAIRVKFNFLLKTISN